MNAVTSNRTMLAPTHASGLVAGLVGDRAVPFPAFSGLCLTAGVWLDDADVFGVEGGGFALERLTHSFTATSDKAGNPAAATRTIPDVSAAMLAKGLARAYAGGRSVPVSLLTYLADDLVAVHGQADQQQLLKPARQRRRLPIWGVVPTKWRIRLKPGASRATATPCGS